MVEKKLPEGWEWKRLGDLITYKKGRKPDILLEQKGEGVLPYLTAGYFRTGTPKNFVPLDYHSSCVRCDLNDIVLIWDGSNAGDVFKGLTGVLASTMIRIEPRVQQFLPNFAFLFLKTQFQTLKSRTTGSSIPHISKSVFENLKVPLPPIETQRKIVEILEKAEETQKLRMQADELTSQLLQSVFLEMFGDPVKNPKGWDVVKLEEICDNERKVTYGIVQPGKEVESGIPIVRSVNLIENSISLEGLKKIDPQIEASHPRSRLRGGELLVSVRGTVGPVAIASIELENANMSRGVAIVAPNSRCMVEYLLILFKTSTIQHWISVISKGIALKQLNLVELRKLKIPLPPLDIQQKFAQIVEKVEAMRQKQKQSQQEIDNLFNALTQKAFKGELIA